MPAKVCGIPRRSTLIKNNALTFDDITFSFPTPSLVLSTATKNSGFLSLRQGLNILI